MPSNPLSSVPGESSSCGLVSTPISGLVLFVGLLFGICIVGLNHSTENLDAVEENSVEAGSNIEEIEAFHKDVNSAPIGRKLSFVILILLGAYCHFTAPVRLSVQNPTVLLAATCCMAWLASSFLWSVGWQDTAREFVRVVAYCFVAVGFARRFRPQELDFVIMLGVFCSVLAACLASVLSGNFRPWIPDFRLHGSIHSNLLAQQGLVVLLAAVALLPVAKKKFLWWMLILTVLTVIVLTKSRGALAAAMFGIIAINLVGKRFSSVALVASALVTCLLAAALVVSVSGSQVQERLQGALVLGRSKEVGTLTGRIPLWQAVWEESRGRHWIGHGYGAFWSVERTEKLAEELKWFPRHAHSAYMHTILDLGFIGLGLVLWLVFVSVRAALRCFRETRDPAYCFFMGFIVTGLLDGATEIAYVSPRELGLYVGMAVMGLVILHPQEQESMAADSNPSAANSRNQNTLMVAIA